MREPLLEMASDLCADLAPGVRYRRLVQLARQLVPCDAIALLRLDEGALVPVVADGLRPEALARRFHPAEHPRLQKILAAPGPIRLTDPNIPDPFDGLFSERGDVHSRVHACMGCPLIVEGRLIGVLTLDAISPTAFDRVDDETVALLAALAGAAIHTAVLIAALHEVSTNELVAHDLVHDVLRRGPGEIVGASPAIVRVREEIALLANNDLTTLVTGETGVGKELVVDAIHAQSRRHDRPLIHVNCSALPESLAESELFGHLRGAFTGAHDQRGGKFEAADGGTLFLDEIGDLPLAIQPKLLRVLQSGEVQRVGADRGTYVDVRVIAATNRDLRADIEAGRFRGDLYYRLGVYPLHVPPLRARREDIPLLCGHFLELAGTRLGVGHVLLSVAARARILDHAWPGNVRELEHTMLRAAVRASGGKPADTVVIEVADLGLESAPDGGPPRVARLRDAVDEFTSRLILATVAESGNNWAEAARRLGLQRGNLHRLAHRLGVHPGA